jgi:hypothetical protein
MAILLRIIKVSIGASTVLRCLFNPAAAAPGHAEKVQKATAAGIFRRHRLLAKNETCSGVGEWKIILGLSDSILGTLPNALLSADIQLRRPLRSLKITGVLWFRVPLLEKMRLGLCLKGFMGCLAHRYLKKVFLSPGAFGAAKSYMPSGS